jgi:hypothetical protein
LTATFWTTVPPFFLPLGIRDASVEDVMGSSRDSSAVSSLVAADGEDLSTRARQSGFDASRPGKRGLADASESVTRRKSADDAVKAVRVSGETGEWKPTATGPYSVPTGMPSTVNATMPRLDVVHTLAD